MPSDLIPFYLYSGPYPTPRPTRLYDYLLAEQGLIKRVENRLVSVDHLLVPVTERLTGLHLHPWPLTPLTLKFPRIPACLLAEVLADARRELDREVMYHFCLTDQGWAVSRPPQEQSGVRVGYTGSPPPGLVLDLHSHNRMPAFFSPTDDRDEQGGRFYAVIGHLDRPQPQFVLRLGLYGSWRYNIPGLTLFNDLGPLVDTFASPAEEAAMVDHRPADCGPRGWLAGLFNRRP